MSILQLYVSVPVNYVSQHVPIPQLYVSSVSSVSVPVSLGTGEARDRGPREEQTGAVSAGQSPATTN